MMARFGSRCWDEPLPVLGEILVQKASDSEATAQRKASGGLVWAALHPTQ